MTTTSTRHRSFTTKGKAQKEPVTFDLDGELFTCRAQVPGTVMLEHVSRLSDGQTAAAELLAIWRDVFSHERDEDDEGEEIEGTSEHERFRAYVDSPDNEVDVQDLGAILTFVLEELSGRPTPASSPSGRGRSTTGGTSQSGSKRSAPKKAATQKR